MTKRRTTSDLAGWIAKQGIDAHLLRDAGETPTVSAAAKALGVTSSQIVKTLVFLVDHSDEADLSSQPVAVISNGEGRISQAALASYFNVDVHQVKLASPAIVQKVTGYPAGGVPPFGHVSELPLLIDQTVVDFEDDTTVYAGGGDDRTMLRLTVEELLRVTEPVAVLPLSE